MNWFELDKTNPHCIRLSTNLSVETGEAGEAEREETKRPGGERIKRQRLKRSKLEG